MTNLDTSIDTAIEALRELAYAANCEWEKQGKNDVDLMNLSVRANELLTEFTKALHGKGFTKPSKPSSITLLPNVQNPQKIQAIKTVREYTGLGLREAKDIVDGTMKLDDFTYPASSYMTDAEFIVKMHGFGFAVK